MAMSQSSSTTRVASEESLRRDKSDVSVPHTSPSDVSVSHTSPSASKHRSEAGVVYVFLSFILFASFGFRSHLPAPSFKLLCSTIYPSFPLPLPSRGVREGVQAQDNQWGRKNDTSTLKGTGALMFRNDTLVTKVPESAMMYYTPIGSRVMIYTELPESEIWRFGGGAGALY